jgi:hypothetical protein
LGVLLGKWLGVLLEGGVEALHAMQKHVRSVIESTLQHGMGLGELLEALVLPGLGFSCGFVWMGLMDGVGVMNAVQSHAKGVFAALLWHGTRIDGFGEC